jgi:hypothetical protein
MLLGVGLMAFPWFTPNWQWTWGVGAVLTLGLFWP